MEIIDSVDLMKRHFIVVSMVKGLDKNQEDEACQRNLQETQIGVTFINYKISDMTFFLNLALLQRNIPLN